MLIAVAINWTAWATFLLSTPPLAESEFHAIAEQRTKQDTGGGLDLVTDIPTVMAARSFGGYRPMPIQERLLFFMAGVPALMAEQYVVPARYLGTPPNRGESRVIGIVAFILSTAFWVSVTGGLGWLRRRRDAAR